MSDGTMTRTELQDAARKAFGANGLSPDAAASRELMAEMGWLMMAVPEDKGGLGLGCEAVGVIHLELGRALVPGAAIAQMMVVEALAGGEADGLDDLLAAAMGGEAMTASLAGPARAGGDARTVACVPDADRAAHLLLIAPGRLSLAPIADADIAARDTWDKSRRLFDVTVADGVTGVTIAEGPAADALAERVQGLMLLSLAADSLGGAEAALAMTIDYLKTRRQFDRPLALFQALKHRCADMRTWLTAADALFWSRTADDRADLASTGALKAHVATVYRAIAEEAIQLHGGIGLTMEHPCHLFLKRAMLNCALGGDADHWEELAGRRLVATLG
ncbi:MAG: acyl-CoA dehydrogenase [Sphingomonas sp.]